MKLFKHVVRSMDQNVYFYYDENTMEGVVIDPGNDAKKIMSLVEGNGINVKAILLTHGHGDHIGAIPEIKEKYNWPVAAHSWEVPVLTDERANLSGMITGTIEFAPDIVFEDNDIFEVGGCKLKVIHTPGHTIGGVCYYDDENRVLFAGDTLFYASVGRTDFPNPPVKDGIGYPSSENFDRLMSSIKDKLYALPDETVVYTGHGGETHIGFEKKFNPFVKG
ncbi:Hydroxyacylglutathione hydrolase GloC [bioreactor metagenome]|uniref:Hydroxyacylglutathione hydrolase GloC n=1 Tax=bioreactor metagenome TaxID=1076179 RepID=A0A645EN94_9ZZZZ|nr:MBL fold metallo-hydrolase [Lachnospiraceae bacterium]